MKKAMSPLISTVILIGFAIALGGIVMGWGEQTYAHEDPQGCQAASLKLIRLADNEGACLKDNNIEFTVQNDGNVPLSQIRVHMIGDEITETAIKETIDVADIKKHNIPYQNAEKLIFTPVFEDHGLITACPKSAFAVDSIPEC